MRIAESTADHGTDVRAPQSHDGAGAVVVEEQGNRE